MRKDFGNKTRLKKFYYSTYEVSGLNLESLLNRLYRQGVSLYFVKKYKNKRLRFCVRADDEKKVFAICDELCYNIKRCGNNGILYPFLYLYKNVGLLIGCLAFMLIVYFASDFVLSFSFTGTGSAYKRQALKYLNDNGVKTFSRFSELDLKSLQEKILSDGTEFSFVGLERVGNTLKVNLVLASETTPNLTGKATELIADTDGVVESIKVYRGRPLVRVGERVEKGQTLADGIFEKDEQTIEVGVIATASIACDKVFKFILPDGQEEIALALAEGLVDGQTIIFKKCEKQVSGVQTVYTVKLTCRRVVSVG